MIIVGADTPIGVAVARAIAGPDREVRAFISSMEPAEALRAMGVKVALGDLSDGSHIEAAATGCFTAILVSGAVTDGRELAFSESPHQVLRTWAQAISDSKVRRAIWIGSAIDGAAPESRSIDPAGSSDEEVAARVAALDEAAAL